MYDLTKDQQPSLHIVTRAQAMWATKYDAGQHTVIYKVVPWGRKFDHKTVDRRLVIFDAKRQVAECVSLETGEVCEANSFGKLCSHVYAASKRLEVANKRAA